MSSRTITELKAQILTSNLKTIKVYTQMKNDILKDRSRTLEDRELKSSFCDEMIKDCKLSVLKYKDL